MYFPLRPAHLTSSAISFSSGSLEQTANFAPKRAPIYSGNAFASGSAFEACVMR